MGPLNCDQLHLTAQLLVARWASEVSSADVAALSSASAWKPPLEARSPLQFALYECINALFCKWLMGKREPIQKWSSLVADAPRAWQEHGSHRH